MKKLLCFLFALCLMSNGVLGNGVAIVDASTVDYLKLNKTIVTAEVESQIAIITTAQTFQNMNATFAKVRYAFPLSSDETSIDLRYRVNGQWFEAILDEVPQDSTLPGSGGTVDPLLLDYLGETPLYFDIPDSVLSDSTLIVEMTYVTLLPYDFGTVNFRYPNSYQAIQPGNIDLQEFNFLLNSTRDITQIQLQSGQTLTRLINNGNSAEIQTRDFEIPASEDFLVSYSLDLNQLGLFGFSTFQPDTTVPDAFGRGFLTFIAEPDPVTSTTIDKVFTLIVDRSGSMSGSKIGQARDAASFIVNNLNSGDRFNIVDFSSNVTSFKPDHIPFTETSRLEALNYVSNFNASGGTNISGAFDVAMNQFVTSEDSVANIIIFFTDGFPTVGTTGTEQILQGIAQLQNQTSAKISIFTFGIGSSVGVQLLTRMAAENFGLSQILGSGELFDVITDFYLRIRNPILLNTQLTVTPTGVMEVYPDPLPNLYLGQQMIVSARYSAPQPVTITLSGEIFGQPISYDYNIDLADSSVDNFQFLPKIWAKSKIEKLLVDYNSLDPNSPEAQQIKSEIIQISFAYRVISPFTSFTGGTPVGIEDEPGIEDIANLAQDFVLLGNYPNPFNPSTTIRLQVNSVYVGKLQIKIYNMLGRVVRVLEVDVNGPGTYSVQWDGLLASGQIAASGTYVYVVSLNNTVLAKKMQLVK